MRLMKFLTVSFATAALAVPAATAGNGHGKGNGHQAGCRGKAKVSIVLKGTFAAAAGDGSSFTMNALRANRHGRPYLKLTQPMQVTVDAKTRYVKAGEAATLASLVANDRLVVKSKASRCDLRKAESPDQLPALTARMVVDQGPAEAPSSDSSDS
jgi:hypothetical protein